MITTAIWEATLSFPPDYGRAAALGLSLSGAMVLTLGAAKFIMRKGSYATISGKAFRPRPMEIGAIRWLLMAISFQPMLRFYRLSPLWGLALPIIAGFYAAFTLESAIQHGRGRGGMWKGRAQAGGAP